MKAQFDYTKRIVSLENLKAMCARISSTCHTFRVCDVTKNRVRVIYSNPDEYGSPEPIIVLFPAYEAQFGSTAEKTLCVVLDAVRYFGCTGKNEEAWQAFDQLYDCEKLWRKPGDGTWQTEYESLVETHPQYTVQSRWLDESRQQWFIPAFPQTEAFDSWRKAQAEAVRLFRTGYKPLFPKEAM